jgi:hypothetical protein
MNSEPPEAIAGTDEQEEEVDHLENLRCAGIGTDFKWLRGSAKVRAVLSRNLSSQTYASKTKTVVRGVGSRNVQGEYRQQPRRRVAETFASSMLLSCPCGYFCSFAFGYFGELRDDDHIL